MSQIPAPTGMTARTKPGLDIYGVLILIATAFVIAATSYVFYKSAVMLGNPFPIAGD